MLEYTQINVLQSKLDTCYGIKMTGQYMEPKNDIIKDCLDQIDNTVHTKDTIALHSSISSDTTMSIYEDDSDSGVPIEY